MMVVYKTLCIKEKRIATVSSEVIEKCLAPIWSQLKYIERSVRNATIEARFERANIAEDISMRTLKMRK